MKEQRLRAAWRDEESRGSVMRMKATYRLDIWRQIAFSIIEKKIAVPEALSVEGG